MTIIQLKAAPPRLEGWLSRWLMEPAPGLFVGKVNSRIREELWTKIEREIEEGEAVMAWPGGLEPDLNLRFAGEARRRRLDSEGFVMAGFSPQEWTRAGDEESDEESGED